MGILDWGIGGLGLYKLVKKEAPGQAVLYFSDSGFHPYGKVKTAELAARLTSVLQSMKEIGAEKVVVACNAASTVLDHINKKGNGLPELTGIIEHGIRAALEQKKKSIGIIGGRRTVSSGLYRRALRNSGFQVTQRVAQPLSALIEAGDFESGLLDRELSKILKPINDVDVLLLGCTHYPAIADLIKKHLPTATVIDPAEEALEWLGKKWGFLGQDKVEDFFFTTGCKKTTSLSAERAFGVNLGSIKKFTIKN